MSLDGRGLTCRYANATVFADLDVTLEPGRLTGLTGPSGSGKTSLARILCGLRRPEAGSVRMDDRPVETRRGRMTGDVGLLQQSPRAATNPRMTLRGIIAEPGAGPAAERGLVDRAGLTADLLTRLPSEVSEGQLQRACLARALAAAPRFLICDEATAMLDAASTAAVARILADAASSGTGVLMISHDHPLLAAVADVVHDIRDLSARRRDEARV